MKVVFCPDIWHRFLPKSENKKLTITQKIIVNISCSEFYTNRKTFQKISVKLHQHPKVLCHSLYRFTSNSQQINDTTWKSAMPVIVSIFTEFTTDQWYCMEVCSAFHCIDFHRTHNRSTILHGSLLCLSLYRFSLNSLQINDNAWKSAMPTSIDILIETCNIGQHFLNALNCTEVYFQHHYMHIFCK